MLFSCPVLGRTVASLKICRLCFCPINSVLLNLLYVFRFCFRMLAVILVLDLFIFYTQSREIPDKCVCLSPRASSPAIATCWRTSWPVISGSLWEWNQEKIGAHRYVLQSRSGVFFAMLDGPGADRSHMDLPDAQPKVFWQLLRLVAPLNFVLLCVCVGVLTLEVLQNAAFPVFWSIQWECFLMYHGIPQLLLLGVCTGICLMPLIWAWRSGWPTRPNHYLPASNPTHFVPQVLLFTGPFLSLPPHTLAPDSLPVTPLYAGIWDPSAETILEVWGGGIFLYAALSVWNSLPCWVRSSNTFSSFIV